MPKQSVYLDYAAASPLDKRVLKAMEPYFSVSFFNPSATYLASREVKKVIESSRRQVAEILGAKSSEIVFSAGGTEANNLAIAGIMNNYPGSNLVISAIEHPSVQVPAKSYKYKTCPVSTDGLVDINKLEKLIDDKTVLVSVMYVNNEIGTIEPLKDIAATIRKVRERRLERGINLPLYFHADACQAANYLDLHVSRLGVDLMSLNGGKMYGPKQSGILFVKSNARLKPLIAGGGQERGLRSGTENVAGIVGFTKALKLAQESNQTNARKVSALQAHFTEQLTKLFPNAVINGSLSKRIVNNVHVTFKGVDNEWLLIKLDNAGIMAAAGSACSASNDKPSTTLAAIGLSDKDAQSSIRFSLGNSSTLAQLDYVLSILTNLLKDK